MISGPNIRSLSYLKMFPIDKLKIDKSFLADMPQDTSSADIVRAIIAMGRSMKLKVIAEGVETRAQVEFLRENGCHYIQGFYFSNPVPADELWSIGNKPLMDKY